ncbi:phospholipase A2 [Corynebacterium kroppenstedtii]
MEVPPDYRYDGKDGDDLHDYCSYSPDQFPAPGVNADFSGACARHDMCYERVNAGNGTHKDCNDAFERDMHAVCNNVYSGHFSLRRPSCNATVDIYVEGVRHANS